MLQSDSQDLLCMTHHTPVCRQRDNEIASLRLMLSERDDKINSTMTELAEVHEQLRCQESSLQQAYNQLADASRDKARVRQQLLENQTELTGVRCVVVLCMTMWPGCKRVSLMHRGRTGADCR